MNILITNCLILPMTATGEESKYFKGNVGVKGNTIAMVSAESSDAEMFAATCGNDLQRIDAHGKLLMPGLINTHNHVSMTLMRSYADDIPLMRWLNEYIWPFESKLTCDDIKVGAELGIAEMLLGGTTTFVDMYWFETAVADVVLQSGIRGVLSPTCVDSNFEAFEVDVKTLAEKIERENNPRLRMMIAPHAPYTCSIEHLRHAADLAAHYNIGIHIHVAETLDEVAEIAQRYGMTPMEHINNLGLLNQHAIAVHSVHLTDSDIDILEQTGASVAHNPQSNMKISSGTAPIVRLLERGVNVSIGTDGACSNNDLDMWDEMRSASFLQKLSTADPCVLPAYQVLQMATVGGAQAIGMQGRLGIIKVGALADMILIDIEKPHMYPQHDMVANLVYCVKSSDVDTVIVDGEILVQSCRLLRQNVKDLCRKAQETVEDIAKRA